MVDRLKVKQRVAAKIQDEMVKRHTFNIVLSQGLSELVEALCDELENKKSKKDD